MPPKRPPHSLTDLKPAPYNPRIISDPAAFGLKESLYTFGDLSGVVHNAATGHIICAHQRREGLIDLDISAIRWGRRYTVTLGFRAQRFASRERDGWATLPDGARFRLRQVAWPEPFERAANFEANNRHIEGDWSPDAPAQLQDLRRTLPDLVMEELQFDALLDELGDFADDGPQEKPEPTVAESYQVIIDCESETQQRDLFDRLTAEGLDCRLIVL